MHIRASHFLAGCLATAALSVSLAAHAGPNIVVNGGFESGSFTPGWTQFGDTSFSGVDTFAPLTGTFAAFFGPIAPGGIFQTLVTAPGDFYTVRFSLMNEADVNGVFLPNSVSVNWDGGAAEFSLTNAPVSAYQSYSFIVRATSASTDLRFTFTQPSAFWDLDDVSAVPEPGSLALVALAGSLVALARRRRNA